MLAFAARRATLPVSASMRRTPEATALSPITEIMPMSPRRFTWVPPHSSTDQPSVLPLPAPIDTTRTSSPYFSPNSARAPAARASSTAISRVVTSPFCSITSLAMSSMRRSSSARDRLRMREVEAQPLRRHQRAALRDVIAEHLAQRLVQQMRRRMVGADRRTARVIDLERQRSARLQCRPARPCRHARTGRRAFFCVSVTRKRTPSPTSTPVSPTWPPDSP